nr:MAG TPA: hypothetical protein [Caudoviricetes sp.]
MPYSSHSFPLSYVDGVVLVLIPPPSTNPLHLLRFHLFCPIITISKNI